MNYLGVIPQICKYIKNSKLPGYKKHRLFATGGNRGRIDIFSNSLEYMGSLWGHEKGTAVRDLLFLTHREKLVSAGYDKTVKIWDLERKYCISTLSGHTHYVSVLCHPRSAILVSGSWDKSLIVWNIEGECCYVRTLTGHNSDIQGLCTINQQHIISAEAHRDIRIWDLDQGTCTFHLSPTGECCLFQMKKYEDNIQNMLAVSLWVKVIVWNIEDISCLGTYSSKQYNLSEMGAYSIEFLSKDILLIGNDEGKLVVLNMLLDAGECKLSANQQTIKLHLSSIVNICRIAKNIVITTGHDNMIKALDPLLRKCYFIFNCNEYQAFSITKLY